MLALLYKGISYSNQNQIEKVALLSSALSEDKLYIDQNIFIVYTVMHLANQPSVLTLSTSKFFFIVTAPPVLVTSMLDKTVVKP